MSNQHKTPLIGWNSSDPTLKPWIESEASRRGITRRELLDEMAAEYREKHDPTPEGERLAVGTMGGFNDLVLSWLRSPGGHPEATTVVGVSGSGTDDAGDTNHGFYSTFHVCIAWCDATGAKHVSLVEGVSMASLWHWVTG